MKAISPSPFASLPLLPLLSSCLQSVKGKWTSTTRWSPKESTGLHSVWRLHFAHLDTLDNFVCSISECQTATCVSCYRGVKSDIVYKQNYPKTDSFACFNRVKLSMNITSNQMWQHASCLCDPFSNLNKIHSGYHTMYKVVEPLWLHSVVCQLTLWSLRQSTLTWIRICQNQKSEGAAPQELSWCCVHLTLAHTCFVLTSSLLTP